VRRTEVDLGGLPLDASFRKLNMFFCRRHYRFPGAAGLRPVFYVLAATR
jgi:hypothetical protein